MGNEISSIKDYQIGQPFVSNAESALKVSVAPATNLIDNKKYTTFRYPKEKGKLDEAAEKHIEILRTTRHPYILKYCATFEEGKKVILVTEHVIPLDVAVDQQEKLEIYAGIFNILQALLFLHERRNICHNSINVSSVYITDDGVWKLAAFENSSKVLRLSKQSYDNDISGFAEFALSVLEYLKDDDSTTTNFMRRLEEEFVNENKEISGTLNSLINDPFFQFPFLQILDWLEKLALKSTMEKRQFFGCLATKLQEVPSIIISKRLIPLLFSQLVICDPAADEIFLKHLFASGNAHCAVSNIKPVIDEEHFKKHSIPYILSLLESRDRTVRLIVMKYLPYCVDYISKDLLQNMVLPELLVGLKDYEDSIVTSTFYALATLVPLLGSQAVVGGERMTCFFDRTPDFTRVPRHGKSSVLSPLTNVSDVMAQTKLSPPHSSNTEDMAEKKKRRRLEREKTRQEQRQRREQRKQEREAQKSNRLESQSSEETMPQVSSERDLSSEQNEETDLLKNGNNEDRGEHSEPDWEGFEAFSDTEALSQKLFNSFSAEDIKVHQGMNISPGYVRAQTDDWGWHDTQPTTTVKKESLTSDQNEIIHTNRVESNTKNNSTNQVEHHSPSKSSIKLGKGLDLSQTRKIKPKEISNLNVIPDNKTDLKKSAKLKNSFDVFDITIDKSKLSEPDYFADMIPSFDSNKTKTVIIHDTNSKFNALNLDTEDATGWGDDDDEW